MNREKFDEAAEATPPQMAGFEKFVLAALLLVTFAITALFIFGRGLTHRNSKLGPESASTAALPNIAPPVQMEAPALAALEAFFEAPDFDSKVALVRDSKRVRPMMEDYHQQRDHAFPSLGRVSPGRAIHLDETPMVFFEVEPFSGPRYPVAVIWDGKRFAVDWESLTAYGTMDWNEFIEKQPASPQTLRVFIQNTPDEQSFPGIPSDHATFRIEHRDDPQPLLVTADRDVTAILRPLVEKQRTPATLEIVWEPIVPHGALIPRIVRLVAIKWSP